MVPTTTHSVPHEGFKQEILDGLISNEVVQFQWCVLSAELDTTAVNYLRHMISNCSWFCLCWFMHGTMQAVPEENAKGIRKSLFIPSLVFVSILVIACFHCL